MPPFDSTSAIKKQGRESFSQLWEKAAPRSGVGCGLSPLGWNFPWSLIQSRSSLFLACLREFQILWMGAGVRCHDRAAIQAFGL